MKINSAIPSGPKRARSLVLIATSDVEAALLHQLMLKLREEPLELATWQHAVLDALGDREATVTEIAEKLGESVTAINNRMARLWRMGLLERRAQNNVNGRCFHYRRNIVEEFTDLQENQT